jgi:hypothetical protein
VFPRECAVDDRQAGVRWGSLPVRSALRETLADEGEGEVLDVVLGGGGIAVLAA